MGVYKSTRGLELSGSYNHTVLSSLFHEQASRWPEIARTHVEVVHSRITAFLNRTLAHVVKEEALRFRLQRIISNSSERLLHDALDELVKICNDEEMQPLTYNHYFTDNVQNARQDSMKSAIEKAFKGATNSGKATLDITQGPSVLLSSLQWRIQVDMDQQACDEACTALLAYYKVATKTFVDNVCRQVVERHIMRKLPSIFEPSTVARLSDDEIGCVAMEPGKNVRRRKELQALVDALASSLADLQF